MLVVAWSLLDMILAYNDDIFCFKGLRSCCGAATIAVDVYATRGLLCKNFIREIILLLFLCQLCETR